MEYSFLFDDTAASEATDVIATASGSSWLDATYDATAASEALDVVAPLPLPSAKVSMVLLKQEGQAY